MQRHYESIIILTPLLTDEQVNEIADKYTALLKKEGGELVEHENWGLRKLAYSIEKKSTGFYQLFEFKGSAELVKKLEIEYQRDEKVMRYLTVSLDKYGAEYNERRRKGEVGIRPAKKKKQTKENIESK